MMMGVCINMDKGIHISNNGKFLDKFVQNSGELSLLGKGDGAEVMLQKIKANENVFIEPGSNSEIMEFFYILEGELELEKNNEKTLLKSGDYFYSHHLKDTVQFNTISDVTLLYFSTQPVFHYISRAISDLLKLAEKVEAKDMYTHDHIQRVKDYAVKIGTKINLSKEKIENLAFAALFHDLGKVYVPDAILNKPGKLTKDEFDIIKKHPLDGADLVKDTYFEYIEDIIKQHHERINGSGYPYGLNESDILIEAKIIAVCDTYDAMTTDRVYRKAFSPKEAVTEISSLKGKHYDEKIVDTLIDILRKEGVI